MGPREVLFLCLSFLTHDFSWLWNGRFFISRTYGGRSVAVTRQLVELKSGVRSPSFTLMKKYKFVIYKPGGNNTALVETMVTDPVLKKTVNDLIMAKNPTVEQVGFIDREQLRLEMAGGEFCGNATRCAAFTFLKKKAGSVLIKASGVRNKLQAGVDLKGNVWAQMPIYSDISKIGFVDGLYIVPLQGITQVVVYRQAKFSSERAAKTQAVKILRLLNLDVSQKASGVMFVTRKNNLAIEPVVWVRSIKTLFYETACASGTTAVALVEALKNKSSLTNIPIIQPSGEEITVSVSLKNGKFSKARICGQIKLFGRGEVYV